MTGALSPMVASLRSGRGLLLGKFMPPHRGHQFLMAFARQYASEVTVLVCSLPNDPIPGHLRYGWVRRLFPDLNVIHIEEVLPQEPADHPQFWDIWRDVCRRAEPRPLDFVFASEAYGHKLAEVLGAQFVPVDAARALVPISGTAVRSDPLRHWGMLPACVRPYFARRVCVFGPESTGKTTLAADLARHFHTVWVHEYARPLLDPQAGQCRPEDLERIARGQIASEEAMAEHANRLIVCDTDPLSTLIWSDLLFGTTPDWLRRLADERTYDLYLVTDVDVPWVDDQQRFFTDPAIRRRQFERFVGELETRDRPYRIIRGSWQQRMEAACQAIEEVLTSPPNPSAKPESTRD